MTAPTPEQMRSLADDGRARLDFLDHRADMTLLDHMSTALRAAADQLEAVRQEVSNYAGWYEDGPEDSWRFERDLRTALGMEQYSGGDDD